METYMCPITRDLFLYPVTVACGHSFERDVISQAIATNGRCPVCKEALAAPSCGYKVNIILRETVKRLFPGAVLDGIYRLIR